jgi:hypothetical protein
MSATSLLTRTSFDSASLASQASIAHRFPTAGRWRLDAFGPRGVGLWSMDILVRDGGLPRIALDLAAPSPPSDCCGAGARPLAPHGMLNLSFQSPREGGYALLYGVEGGDPVWDSRRLEAGDHYACMPLRPGLYAVVNQLTAARAAVRVTYPSPGSAPGGPGAALGPALIKAGGIMHPDELTIRPGQVLVFEIGARSHLTVDLQTPDDGPDSRFSLP